MIVFFKVKFSTIYLFSWQARLFTDYGNERTVASQGDNVELLKPKHSSDRSIKKRIHLHVPRKVRRNPSRPSTLGQQGVGDPVTGNSGECAGYQSQVGRLETGPVKSSRNSNKKSKLSVRHSTGSVDSVCYDYSADPAIRSSASGNSDFIGDVGDADKHNSMLSEATQILSSILSNSDSAGALDAARNSFSENDAVLEGSKLRSRNENRAISNNFNRRYDDVFADGFDADCANEENETMANEWCSSPTSDDFKRLKAAEKEDMSFQAHGSDLLGCSTHSSPYEEVVESLVYILISARSGEQILDTKDERDTDKSGESDNDLYPPDAILDELEWRGRQRHDEMWVEMERMMCIAMTEFDIIGVLRAEIKHNELLINEIESCIQQDNFEGWTSPLDENGENAQLGHSRPKRYFKLNGIDHILKLNNLTHLLEATLDQVHEYVYVPGDSSTLGADDKRSIISQMQREVACRKITVLVSSVRTKIIAEYAMRLNKKNNYLKRAIYKKAVNEDELKIKLADALDRVKAFSIIIRDLRNKDQEMQETIGYHKAAAERVRLMERRLNDAEFDRRANIVESERIQDQLRQQIGEQSRQIASLRNALDQQERRRNASREYSASRPFQLPAKHGAESFDEGLRYIDATYSVSQLSRISEEELSKSMSTIENLSAKVRCAQDEIKDRKIKELELKEKERKESPSDSNTCCICRDEPKSVLLLPCRHLCLCEACSKLSIVTTCPICRTSIMERLHVYA